MGAHPLPEQTQQKDHTRKQDHPCVQAHCQRRQRKANQDRRTQRPDTEDIRQAPGPDHHQRGNGRAKGIDPTPGAVAQPEFAADFARED